MAVLLVVVSHRLVSDVFRDIVFAYAGVSRGVLL